MSGDDLTIIVPVWRRTVNLPRLFASVIATVRNEAPTPYRGTVRLALDGRGVASGAVTLAPGATSDVVIPYQAPAAGTLVAAIDDPSGMGADNERTEVL